ncbi:PIN domain-containing protein [Streptomyces subrutilus]|uniref:PIN domain-containing protein n=1 Tax=Streptomyces subrutilus TaxID=36818 RepID=UPI00340A5B25
MPKKVDAALRSKAVRMVTEHRSEYSSERALHIQVADSLGVSREPVRRWIMIVSPDGSVIEVAEHPAAPPVTVAEDMRKERTTCMKVLDDAGLVVISPLVLNEVDYMARKEFNYDASLVILDEIRAHAAAGRYEIATVTPEILAGASRIRHQYEGLKLDLSDSVTMALAARYDTAAVLTIDYRDFRSVLPLSEHEAFLLLPEDL